MVLAIGYCREANRGQNKAKVQFQILRDESEESAFRIGERCGSTRLEFVLSGTARDDSWNLSKDRRHLPRPHDNCRDLLNSADD